MKAIGKRVGDGIYETYKYSAFQFGNNRPIDRRVVEQKKASIKRIGLLTPIEVTKDFYIKEGQHRFVALKELEMPITYRFSMHDTFNVDEIAEMNSSVNKWSLPTFIKVRANDGNPNYIKLKKIIDRYPDIKTAEIMYAIGKGTQKAIRNGWFTMTESEYNDADAILSQTDKAWRIIAGSPYASRKYQIAFIWLIKHGACSCEALCDALTRRKQWLWQDGGKPGTIKNALERIQLAYNHGRPTKYRIDVLSKYDDISSGRIDK